MVYISDIDQPDEMRVVQRRLLQIKNVPEFKPVAGKPCEVVLVCSIATSRELYKGWRHMLEKEMGMKVDTFGITRYGSFEPSQKTDDGKCLREYMAAGAMIIVLDQSFEHAFCEVEFPREAG